MVGRWLCFWDGLFSVMLVRVFDHWIMGLDTLGYTQIKLSSFWRKNTCLHIGMLPRWPPGSLHPVDPHHHFSLTYPWILHAEEYQLDTNIFRIIDANIQGALCDTKNRSNRRPTVDWPVFARANRRGLVSGHESSWVASHSGWWRRDLILTVDGRNPATTGWDWWFYPSIH